MDTELVYDIARYSPEDDQECLIERAQVVRRAQTLWRRLPDGQQIPASRSESAAALITADPALGAVRADEVTRIEASAEVLPELPLVLQVPGGGRTVSRDKWSAGLWSRHLDSAESAFGRGMHRVLYVNGVRWAVWSTPDGERLLPEDTSLHGSGPLLNPRWGELSFTEWGSMLAGMDSTAVGLLTPGVVATVTWLEDEPPQDVLLTRRGTDAEAFVEWLFNAPLMRMWGGDPIAERILAQLFLEAAVCGHNGEEMPGSRLVATDEEIDGCTGAADTSGWTLTVDLRSDVIEVILDLIAARGPLFAGMVEAARDPGSPQGLARRAWLDRWEAHHRANWLESTGRARSVT